MARSSFAGSAVVSVIVMVLRRSRTNAGATVPASRTTGPQAIWRNRVSSCPARNALLCARENSFYPLRYKEDGLQVSGRWRHMGPETVSGGFMTTESNLRGPAPLRPRSAPVGRAIALLVCQIGRAHV